MMLRVVLLLCALVAGASALNNGLGITPQMGYNSWYDLECSASMNESSIRYGSHSLSFVSLPSSCICCCTGEELQMFVKKDIEEKLFFLLRKIRED